MFIHTELCFCRLVRLHPPLDEHNSPEVRLHRRSSSTKTHLPVLKSAHTYDKAVLLDVFPPSYCLLLFEMNYALSGVSGDKLFFFHHCETFHSDMSAASG